MVLRLRYPAPGDWEYAKCRNTHVSSDYDPFFDEDDPQPALDFCNGAADGMVCPIRHQCLCFALTNNCSSGVWGGTDELTRKAMRRKWPLYQGKVPRPEWKFMSRQEALAGVDPETLLEDDTE
jgi:WhiB family transcriptional regulator, redox-sensing transcriptional regulator